MGYYHRVLGTEDRNVPLESINAAFEEVGIPLSISIKGKKSDPWAELAVTHLDGTTICQVERNAAVPGELGASEIDEFIAEMDTARPVRAASWLREFLPKVKVVYAIQKFSGADITFGWDVIHTIREVIWKHVGGIIQADFEGFSNEEGEHIIWQFSERVTGARAMAVLDTDGAWIRFQMDLGNRAHRRAFLAGEVPASLKTSLGNIFVHQSALL